IVIDQASHFWADVSSPAVSDYNRHQVTRDLPLTFFPGARSLSPTSQRVPGTSVVPLVNSSKNSWGQANQERVGFVEGRDRPGPNTLMVVALRRPITADGAAADGPRSRIAVVGDSDFATNSFFHVMGNGTLFLNTINYLAAQENLIGLRPRTADPPRVHLTNRQMKATFFLSVILVPALLAVVGTAVWWKQH
ncbi:MAG: GldG family protein, partial [Candidatus Rokuibacteriota bacterium]